MLQLEPSTLELLLLLTLTLLFDNDWSTLVLVVDYYY